MTVNTLGSNEQDRSSRTVAEWLWPFLPMGISAFSLSALIWYHLRRDVFERDIHSALQLLYANLYKLIGFAPSVLFFLLALTWSSIWFATGKVDRPLGRLGRLLAMTVMIGILINLGHGGVAPDVHKGELGAWFAEHLVGTFHYLPSLLLVWAVTFASMLLATDFFFSDSFERLHAGRGGELATESGVETAVTDHLRGLGTPTAPLLVPTLPVDPARQVPLPGGATAAGAVAAMAAATPSAEASAPEPLVIDDSAAEPPPEPRRRSYAERRRERERRWEQEEWVPPAPESQEIENPEANALAALDAVAVTPAEPAAPTAAFVAAMAAAPAPAEANAPAVFDGEAEAETETDADLVDVEELEDMVGDDEEVTGRDLEDDGDADEDDRDEPREEDAAPFEIERPIVIARRDTAPVESPIASGHAEPAAGAGGDVAAAGGAEGNGAEGNVVEGNVVEGNVVEADADGAPVDTAAAAASVAMDDDEADDAAAADAEDEAAEDEAADDQDEADAAGRIDDQLETVLEAAAETRSGPAVPAPSAIDAEPVVAIPRPEQPGVWSQVVWRPAPPPATPPVLIPTPTPTPEPVASDESIESIESVEPRESPARDGAEERGAARQQQLFGSWLDEGLIQDAIEVVTSTRRANAALLQRKLRIDYALAIDVLGALAARGVVELEGDSTQGRVLV